MVCATCSYKESHSGSQSIDVPSSKRIRQLTAEIRRSWSPETRARRVAVGATRGSGFHRHQQLEWEFGNTKYDVFR